MADDLRIKGAVTRAPAFEMNVDGRAVIAHPGETIAAALAAAGMRTLRNSPVLHQPRGLYCGMGLCHECMVTVDGRPNLRSCTAAAGGAEA